MEICYVKMAINGFQINKVESVNIFRQIMLDYKGAKNYQKTSLVELHSFIPSDVQLLIQKKKSCLINTG